MEFSQEVLDYLNETVYVVNDKFEIKFCSASIKNL
jgi:hypothetical protein